MGKSYHRVQNKNDQDIVRFKHIKDEDAEAYMKLRKVGLGSLRGRLKRK